MNIQMTEAALKDCLGLPPAMAPGPSQILHCHLMAAPKSPSPRPPESLLLPWTNQGSQPMSMTLMSHVPLAVQPAQQLLLLPNILTIDGIFTTGFGSPKTWILPLSGPLPPADVEWRVLRQGKVPRHWDWGTPSYSLKDTGSKRRPLPKGNMRKGKGEYTEWATSKWDTQCWWKALEQNNVALSKAEVVRKVECKAEHGWELSTVTWSQM